MDIYIYIYIYIYVLIYVYAYINLYGGKLARRTRKGIEKGESLYTLIPNSQYACPAP